MPLYLPTILCSTSMCGLSAQLMCRLGMLSLFVMLSVIVCSPCLCRVARKEKKGERLRVEKKEELDL